MKTCTRCGVERPIAEFATRRKAHGTLQSWCRACHREYAASRYARFTSEQRERKNATTRRLKGEARARLWRHLASQRCVDCGEDDVLVLDFDHRRAKRANVADLISNSAPWEIVSAEIAKCEIRCANCHRRQTAARRIAAPRPTATRKAQDVRPQRLTAANRFDAPSSAGEHADEVPVVCKRSDRALRQPWCRPCHNAQKRKHYRLNGPKERARTLARHHRLVAENAPRLRRYLVEHPCVDCGESDPVVLEFDHIRDKRIEVPRMLWSGAPWTQIALEIAKCEVRCANCHRRRTARQQGFDERKRAFGEGPLMYGDPGRTRTVGLFVRSEALYPLSYGVVN